MLLKMNCMNAFLRKKICNDLVCFSLLIIVALSFHSCFDSDNINEGAYYTFTGETVASYLEANPDYYSEFAAVLDTTEVMNLLSTYGTFTVFAPTNDAMKAYYADSAKSSWRDFDLEVLKEMVYYQIIDSKIYTTNEFPQGRLDDKNMMARFVDVSFENLAASGHILVNSTAEIVLEDQEVHNGIVHGINKVLVPSNYLLPECIRDNSRMSIFAEALYLTGMSDSMLLVKDDSYKQPVNFTNASGATVRTPEDRLYGYTALVETDSIYHLNGIDNLDDLIAYAANVYDKVYPEDAGITDYTDRRNSLNRFVSYHIFDHIRYYNEFTYSSAVVTGSPIVDYIQPMAPYTLLETRYLNNKNVFNVKSDGSYVSMLGSGSSEYSLACVNGIYHAIDGMLVYDDEVINDVLNKRLRIDIYATLPEMMNINYRNKIDCYYPSGFFKNLVFNDDESKVNATIPHSGGVQYQGCMFYIYGWYDVTHYLPPIPEGTWEFRIGIKTRAGNIVQIYVDGMPNGIPLDMSKNAYHADIGWIADADTEDEGYSNDKDLRNRGWMKAPNCFQMYPSGRNARDDWNSLRKILGRYEFEDGVQHVLRIKSVSSTSSGDYFGYDYIEFIPTSQIDDEDRG